MPEARVGSPPRLQRFPDVNCRMTRDGNRNQQLNELTKGDTKTNKNERKN